MPDCSFFAGNENEPWKVFARARSRSLRGEEASERREGTAARRDVSRTAGQPVRSRIPGPKLRFGAEEEERSLSDNVKLSELREFAPVIHATSWSEVRSLHRSVRTT